VQWSSSIKDWRSDDCRERVAIVKRNTNVFRKIYSLEYRVRSCTCSLNSVSTKDSETTTSGHRKAFLRSAVSAAYCSWLWGRIKRDSLYCNQKVSWPAQPCIGRCEISTKALAACSVSRGATQATCISANITLRFACSFRSPQLLRLLESGIEQEAACRIPCQNNDGL
jgi:hypothetical protein